MTTAKQNGADLVINSRNDNPVKIVKEIFAVAGIQLLSIFGISIFNFVAGGVLLFIISIEFLTHGE